MNIVWTKGNVSANERKIVMLNIKENQKLNVMNILSYRGKIKQSELEDIGIDEMISHVERAIASGSG